MMPAYGEPDGHGRYGVLDTDTDGLLICHDCGKACRQLSTHARLAHGYGTAESYRDAHGLARNVSLVSRDASEKMSAAWERNRWWREPLLAEVRDPIAAASRPQRYRVGARVARATAKPPRLPTDGELASLGDWWDVPEWSRRARQLLEGTDLTTESLARALSKSKSTIESRLRRYQ